MKFATSLSGILSLLFIILHYGKGYSPHNIDFLSSLRLQWSKVTTNRNGSVILAAATIPNFYVSTNYGNIWRGWGYSSGLIESTTALGMDSTGKYMVICGRNSTGYYLPLYSTDYGRNTFYQDNSVNKHIIYSVAVTDNQAYYLSTNNGLYKHYFFSAGYEYYQSCPTLNVSQVACSKDGVIVFTSCGESLTRSSASGSNFQTVYRTGTIQQGSNTIPIQIVSIATDASGKYISISLTSNAVMYSVDSGSTWNVLVSDSKAPAKPLSYTSDGSHLTMLLAPIYNVMQVDDISSSAITVDVIADDTYYHNVSLVDLAGSGDGNILYVLTNTGLTQWTADIPTIMPTIMPTVSPSGSFNSPATASPSSIFPPPSGTSGYPTTSVVSFSPSPETSIFPTYSPATALPSLTPTSQSPTSRPTHPTMLPTFLPTRLPTSTPSSRPSTRPSTQPSSNPSLQPTVQPTNPTSQPTNSPSSQPTSRPTGIPNCKPGDYFNRTAFVTSPYQCLPCQPGTASPGGRVISCTICPAGTYTASSSTPTCLPCPLNTYSNSRQATQCSACTGGSITGTTGSLTAAQCVNPTLNFVFGFVALGIAMLFLFIYVIRGRLHRAAFFRRKLLIRKCLLLYAVVMNMINTTQVICKEIFDLDMIINRPHRGMQSYFGSEALRHVLFAVLAIAMIVSVIIFSIAQSLLHVIFSALVMWRSYAYLLLTRNYGFVSRIRDLLQYIDFSLQLHIPIFSYLFYPIVYIVNFFANININLSTINVSCAGAQAPVFLLIDCMIIGVVVVIIESDMQVLWSTTLKGMITRFYGLLLNRVYLFNNLGTSFCFGFLVVGIQSLPEPRKILQYSLSLISVSYFFLRSDGRSPSDTNCDNVSSIPFDTILAISTSIVAYLLIPALLYLFAQILVPSFQIPGLKPSTPDTTKNKNEEKVKDSSSLSSSSYCCSLAGCIYGIKLFASGLLRYISVLITLDWYYIRILFAIIQMIYGYIEDFVLNLYTEKVKLNRDLTDLKLRYDAIREDKAVPTIPNPMSTSTSRHNLLASRSEDALQYYERGRRLLEFGEVSAIVSAPLRSVQRHHLASPEEIEVMATLFREEIPTLSWLYVNEYHYTNVMNKAMYEEEVLPTTQSPTSENNPTTGSELSSRYSITLSSGKATTMHAYYEKADWNAKNVELPSYFQFIVNVMEDFITHGYIAIAAVGMSFNPFLQFFSELGRRVWAHVIANYLIFMFTSVGIWTPLFATNYRLVDKYEEYSQLVDLYPEVKKESQRLQQLLMKQNQQQTAAAAAEGVQQDGKMINSSNSLEESEKDDNSKHHKFVSDNKQQEVEMVNVIASSPAAVTIIINTSKCDGNNCLSNDDVSAIDDMGSSDNNITPPSLSSSSPKRNNENPEEIQWTQIHGGSSSSKDHNHLFPGRNITPLMQTNAAINEIIFADYLSAIVSSRVVLLQLLPYCTIWSIFAVDLAGCPLFVFDSDMQQRLPPFIAWDAYSKAISLYCALYQISQEEYDEMMNPVSSAGPNLVPSLPPSVDIDEENHQQTRSTIRIQTLAEFSELHSDKYKSTISSSYQVTWKVVLLSIYVFFKQSRFITFLRIASLDACATLIIFFPASINRIVQFLAAIVLVDAILNAIYALILVHKFIYPASTAS